MVGFCRSRLWYDTDVHAEYLCGLLLVLGPVLLITNSPVDVTQKLVVWFCMKHVTETANQYSLSQVSKCKVEKFDYVSM